MREDHKRLREVILKQLQNNNIKTGTKKAKEAEYYIVIGYLTMQQEIGEQLDPYLTVLMMSGRSLVEEKVE